MAEKNTLTQKDLEQAMTMAQAMVGNAPASNLAPMLTPVANKQPDKATPDSQPEKTQIAEKSAIHKKVSKGEKLYTWGVYEGLNYWVNLAGSIAIADYFCNQGGKEILNKGANILAKGIAATKIASHEKVFGHSQTALKTLTLLSGGWLLIIPIKIMEDNKRPIVHWLNKKMGVDQTGLDGKEQTPQQIYIDQEQPAQSWVNVILRRSAATLAVVGTGHVLNEGFRDRAKTQAHKAAHPTSKEDPHGGKARTEKIVVDFVNDKIAKYAPNGEALTRDKNGRFQRYLGLAALDTVFTKITSVIMKITNGAGKGQMPQEQGDDAAPSISDKSIDAIQYVKPEYEDQRKAAPGHAARLRSDQGTPAGRDPNLLHKKTVEKAESFTALAERGDTAPVLG